MTILIKKNSYLKFYLKLIGFDIEFHLQLYINRPVVVTNNHNYIINEK